MRKRIIQTSRACSERSISTVFFTGIPLIVIFFSEGSLVPYAELPGLGQCEDDSLPHEDLEHKVRSILHKLKGDKSSWPFLKPVDPEEVPEYYDYIKFPVDLKTMCERYKARYYVHVSFSRLFGNFSCSYLIFFTLRLHVY